MQVLMMLVVGAFCFGFLMFWNKVRVTGKMLCFFLRKDKSVTPQLCQLREAFVISGNRAYDIYPSMVRLMRYPAGWPPFLQELVPAALYDEEGAVPLDWNTLKAPTEGSLSLRSALDENWLRKLVVETSTGGGMQVNWRRILPIALIGVGILGLVFIFMNSM